MGVIWLKRLLSRPAPPPAPVLLRVADPSGGAPEQVEVIARWLPSEHRFDRAHRTAAGLCVLPWFREEDRVLLTVRSRHGWATLEVARDRVDVGRVLDLQLEAQSA